MKVYIKKRKKGKRKTKKNKEKKITSDNPST